MSLLTIILLTHNRPAYAVDAIESILNQSEKDFRFVVSDNSTNKDFQSLMEVRFPKVEYISWFPGIPFHDHFKRVTSLVETQFFVIFHDDDLMEPNYVSRVLQEIKKMPLAAGIGTNAFLIDKDGICNDNQTTYAGPEQTRVITCEKVLLRQYLASDFGGIVPFCSYAFNTELIKGVSLDSSKRDNCDTFFLMEVLSRGPLVWINEPLIKARRHGKNMSSTSSFRDYKPVFNIGQKLLGAIIKQKHIDEYRFLRLFFSLRERRKLPIPALKYGVRIFPKLLLCSHSFRKRTLKKFFG